MKTVIEVLTNPGASAESTIIELFKGADINANGGVKAILIKGRNAGSISILGAAPLPSEDIETLDSSYWVQGDGAVFTSDGYYGIAVAVPYIKVVTSGDFVGTNASVRIVL